MANSYGNFSAKTVTHTCMNIPNNAWTAVPTTAMEHRQLLEVYVKDENKVYWTFAESATLAALVSYKEREALGGGEVRIFPVQDNLTLYLKSNPNTGSSKVVITEYK